MGPSTGRTGCEDRMMPSRGMGDIAPSKMPGAKKIVRKDNPNDVTMYARGGSAKKRPKKAVSAARKGNLY